MASVNSQLKNMWRSGGMLMRLIMINVAVFALILLLKVFINMGFGLPLSENTGVFYLATTADLPTLIRRPWTIITHMFTHESFLHIAFNMLFLWFLGRPFQEMFGARKLLATYLLGGLVGFVAMVTIINLAPAIPTQGYALGASAAVMAIFIGYATYFPEQLIRLIFIGPVKLKYVAIFYVVADFLALGGVDNFGGHVAHLGGAFYGFMLMSQLKKGRDIGLWFENFLDRLVNFSRGSSNMRVKYRSQPKADKRKYKTDEEYNAEKNARSANIDKILDKIGKSGYDSLTKDEKDFLFRNHKDL